MSPEVVRTPDHRFAHLPGFDFEPRYAEWKGLRLHYVDEGKGPPVVLFHGEPTWSYLYRYTIRALVAGGFRAIAPDYPGFGRSDKPLDREFYSYDRMVAATTDLLSSLDLADATAVVHDWGGPIGLRIATERPWFDRLVLLNTGLSTGRSKPSPGFRAWRAFVERTEDLPIDVVLRNAQVAEWPDEVIAAYEAPFPDPPSKAGARALPLIVPLTPQDPGAVEMQRVVAALGGWSRPALVLFGADDIVLPTSVGERLAALIPGADRLETIAGAGHFLQEDRPTEVTEHILRFLTSTL